MPNKERTLAIDDCRECSYAHMVCRTYETGLAALQKLGPWETLYLDHDLGNDQPGSGDDILKFLRGNLHLVPKEIVLITANPVGRKNMEGTLKDIKMLLEQLPPDDVCCCGDSMDSHPNPMDCGHSPVSARDYALSQEKAPEAHPMNVIPSAEQKPKVGLLITELVRDIVNLGGKVLFTKDRGGDSMTLYVDAFSPHSHLGQPDGGSKMLEKHLIASLSQALEEAKK